MADNEFWGKYTDGFVHPAAVPHALTSFDRQRFGRIFNLTLPSTLWVQLPGVILNQ